MTNHFVFQLFGYRLFGWSWWSEPDPCEVDGTAPNRLH